MSCCIHGQLFYLRRKRSRRPVSLKKRRGEPHNSNECFVELKISGSFKEMNFVTLVIQPPAESLHRVKYHSRLSWQNSMYLTQVTTTFVLKLPKLQTVVSTPYPIRRSVFMQSPLHPCIQKAKISPSVFTLPVCTYVHCVGLFQQMVKLRLKTWQQQKLLVCPYLISSI